MTNKLFKLFGVGVLLLFQNTSPGAAVELQMLPGHVPADVSRLKLQPMNRLPATSGKDEIPQGAVVVIDDQNPGQLRLSDHPYDTRVAGVVSGANGISPGIQMQQQGVMEGGKNVALTGRVYVQADTSNGTIKPGDLLTTSSTPGHAMKVSDHSRAAGAILGKAMTGLSEGKGMVLVLVTLQ
jgi:hypothetical protein